MDKQEILDKIAALKAERKTVAGTPCETYTRTVGYLRPKQAMHKAKRLECDMRKMFKIEDDHAHRQQQEN